MSCCDDIDLSASVYVPLSQRLVDFGVEIYGEKSMTAFPITKMWIFTFVNMEDSCVECGERLNIMQDWFTKYALFTEPINHVKWIIEDESTKNLIWKDIGLTNTPVHLFCDGKGSIWELFYGYPNEAWLDRFVLPMVNI